MSQVTAEEKRVFAEFERRNHANQPNDRDEGLGTVYERVVMNRYLAGLVEREALGRVLEHPADGVTGVIGCNSLALGEAGHDVVLANPVPEILQTAAGHWREAQAEPSGLVAADLDEFPFADGSFDLVWNFCIFERFAHPEALIREMARVSRRYVLVMTQNVWNVGTALHAVYHGLTRQPWDHGMPAQMRVRAVKRAFGQVGLETVECGAIDTPPWVDTWDMPMRGYLKRVLGLLGRKWEWETPTQDETGDRNGDSRLVSYLSWIEDQLPRPTVFWQTHHWYVLGRKAPPRAA